MTILISPYKILSNLLNWWTYLSATPMKYRNKFECITRKLYQQDCIQRLLIMIGILQSLQNSDMWCLRCLLTGKQQIHGQKIHSAYNDPYDNTQSTLSKHNTVDETTRIVTPNKTGVYIISAPQQRKHRGYRTQKTALSIVNTARNRDINEQSTTPTVASRLRDAGKCEGCEASELGACVHGVVEGGVGRSSSSNRIAWWPGGDHTRTQADRPDIDIDPTLITASHCSVTIITNTTGLR